MNLSYILNHLGEDRENYKQAVAPPIFQNSNFTFNTVSEMRASLSNEKEIPFYTRGCNPTVKILRQKLAALEGAEDCLVFASGSAAIAAAIMSEVQQGDHVICIEKPYSWTYKLLTLYLSKFGIKSTFIDGTAIENFEQAIQQNTKVIMLESPNSMTFELQDLEAVAQLAKQNGITTICDNSYNTGLLQSPIAMGIDISCHSGTKYYAGHSDLVAGVLVADKLRVEKIFSSEFMTIGGIISPHDAWLMLRSLRTLPVRLDKIADTTAKVVAFLSHHPKVKSIIYPFDKNFPQYDLAKKQMKKCGGLFSIQLATDDVKQVELFCDNLDYFILACSWGSYESLVFPAAALETSANYSNNTLPINHVRLYIGLEDPEVLIADLNKALDLI